VKRKSKGQALQRRQQLGMEAAGLHGTYGWSSLQGSSLVPLEMVSCARMGGRCVPRYHCRVCYRVEAIWWALFQQVHAS
jgi:hypothetical protein